MTNRRATLAVISILSCSWLYASAAYGDDINLPFWQNDLQPSERLYTRTHKEGIQAKGRDITVKRFDDGDWTPIKPGGSQNNNSDHLIYGRDFLAMRDGEVIACWRNFPENPKPGS